MPVTAELLRNVMAEARPIIERQMNDAKIIAGFRDLIASNGGDWSALKALIKAHVEDEADDDGGGKRVQKILDKADSSTAYADMLGLAKMNEENFSANLSYSQSGLTYADEKGRNDTHVQPVGTLEASAKSAQDDVGATASSTNSAHKPAGDLAADNGDKDRGSLPVGGPVHSHSPAAIPLGAANSAGEAPSSSPASPARHSDDIDLTIPAFLRRDEGRGYPKREAVEA